MHPRCCTHCRQLQPTACAHRRSSAVHHAVHQTQLRCSCNASTWLPTAQTFRVHQLGYMCQAGQAMQLQAAPQKSKGLLLAAGGMPAGGMPTCPAPAIICPLACTPPIPPGAAAAGAAPDQYPNCCCCCGGWGYPAAPCCGAVMPHPAKPSPNPPPPGAAAAGA
jgi:hypothetical protein